MDTQSAARGGLTLALVFQAACGGHGGTTDPGEDLSNCAAGTAVLSVLPVAISEFSGWVPLGQINPPGHTLPTDHQNIYLSNPDQGGTPPVRTVVSPGAITVTGVRTSQYHETAHTDYSVMFAACQEIRGEFAYMQSLVPDILNQVGAIDQGCNSYSPNPGLTVTQCASRPVSVKVTAGATLGTSGGVAGQFGLDFSLWDRRITPLNFANASRYSGDASGFDHFHIVPASDYFAEPARSTIRTKLGRYDGLIQRTVAPYGGTIAIDIPGTAQGVWFNDAAPTTPEGPHLALSPDNVDPTIQAFSVGLSQPGMTPAVVRFTPSLNGTINRSFAQVTPGPTIYCYEGSGFSGALLLRLADASTLRLEGRSGGATCAGSAPYSFTAASFDYKR